MNDEQQPWLTDEVRMTVQGALKLAELERMDGWVKAPASRLALAQVEHRCPRCLRTLLRSEMGWVTSTSSLPSDLPNRYLRRSLSHCQLLQRRLLRG